MPSTSRGSAVLSLVRRRFIGMVKVSFGMLFDCVTLSSKHMLQVRCSLWGLSRPSPFAMNTPHTGGLLGLRFKRLRLHRTLTLAPALADAAVAAAAAAAAAPPAPAPAPAAIAAAAAPAREGGGEEEDDARRGGGDEGPAQAAAAADDDDDDDAREDAAAAPGRPFDSDKARGAESGRSRPRSKPNATSMNLTLRGCHAAEL
jgi:hypothetical protein